MKVLVTGGEGFIGRHICAHLKAAGATPLSFDIRAPQDGTETPWQTVQGSVLDRDALKHAMAGCEGIIHCAAIAALWTRAPGGHDAVNVIGTQNAIAAAKDAGARLVHVSSYTVLMAGRPGTQAKPLVLDEHAIYPPNELLGPYPKSKRKAEILIEAAAREGLAACMVLPASSVGPGDTQLTAPSGMILDLARGALPAYLDCPINLVDVRSVARGAVAALHHGEPGERYLLSGEDLRLGDLARQVEALTGVAAPKHRVPYGLALMAGYGEAVVSRLTGRAPKAPLTGVKLAGQNVRFSNAKARDMLGFTPPTLESALKDALLWMADQGLISDLPPASS